MTEELATSLLGAVILLAALGAGGWRWLWPRCRTLGLQGVGLIMLIVLTAAGGFFGAIPWWMDNPDAFAWDLPPLAGRMLAAAGWSFVVPAVFALERPSRGRLRLVLVLLTVYLAPLVLAIFLLHLNRFDFSRVITWSFFLIAGGMTVASLWYLLRTPVIIADGSRDAEPPSVIARIWLALVAGVTGLWGLALFLTDDGPSSLIWVWPGDLLTSRLIAVMLLAIAAGALLARRSRDLARIILAMCMVYGLGVALASLWNAFSDKPLKEAYVVVFTALFFGSLLALVFDRRSVLHGALRPATQ